MSDVLALSTLGAGLGTGAAIDLRCRRIPNVVSLTTAAAGLGLALTGVGAVTPRAALLGMGIGLLLMLPAHLIGGMGAGDVKLFAAAGAVLGSGQIVRAFLFVMIAGGVLALVVAARRGRLARTWAALGLLWGRPAAGRAAIESTGENNRFAYGPAIAAGCLLAALF